MPQTRCRYFKSILVPAASLLAVGLCCVRSVYADDAVYQNILPQDFKEKAEGSCEPGLFFADNELHAAGKLFGEKKYADAAKILKDLIEKAGSKKIAKPRLDLLYFWLADCHYLQARYGDALADYRNCRKAQCANKALELASWRGELACATRLERFAEASEAALNGSRMTSEIFGSGDINHGWALFRASEALGKCGKGEEAATAYRRAIAIFRKTNLDRLASEHGIKCATECAADEKSEKLRLSIWRLVFGTTNKGSMPDELFEVKEADTHFTHHDYGLPGKLARQTHAPGYVWADPLKEPAGVIVCIHGLGLHHKSFESFAREMLKDGFIVIAFDVRGFGSYLDSQGQEKLDLEACVKDMLEITGELKKDYSDLPVFMLGESMGGAIALRLCATAPDLVDGLVCSVPAGKRYRAGTTALTVALHYVNDPDKPFAIGRKVVEQSTQKQTERRRWQQDPLSRLDLAPRELLAFQRFMNDNPRYAREIKRMPVILFQGDEDRLVKKRGTYDLFEAIASKQKTLVVLGNSEHLIFEAPEFKDDITMGVTGWLKAHGARCEYIPPSTKETEKGNGNGIKSQKHASQ